MRSTEKRAVIRRVLQKLEQVDPTLAERLTLHKTGAYAVTGRGTHFGLAVQSGGVRDSSGKPASPESRGPRLAVQVTIDLGSDSLSEFERLRARKEEIQGLLGHPVSWLPNGDNLKAKRAIIRSWHNLTDETLDGDIEEWAARELTNFVAVFSQFGISG